MKTKQQGVWPNSFPFDTVLECERMKIELHRQLLSLRCNILMHHSFSGTHKVYTQTEYQFVYVPRLLSTSFSMHCASQGVYRDEQVFTFARVGCWNIMQVRMLHRIPAVCNSF